MAREEKAPQGAFSVELRYNKNMNPSQSLPQSNLVSTETPPNEKLSDKITESVGDFVKDNHESYLHSMVNFAFMVLNFVKSSIIGMVRQVLNKE